MTTQKLQWPIDLSPLTKRGIIYDLFKVVGIPGMVLLFLLLGISLVGPGTFDLETVLAWVRKAGRARPKTIIDGGGQGCGIISAEKTSWKRWPA